MLFFYVESFLISLLINEVRMKRHPDYMVVVMKDKTFAGAVDVESGREFGTLLSAGERFTQIANYDENTSVITFDDLEKDLTYTCYVGTVALLARAPSACPAAGSFSSRFAGPRTRPFQNFRWN